MLPRWCFIANYQCKLHQRPPRIFPENMAVPWNSWEILLPSCLCSGYKLPWVLCWCHVLLVSLFPVILGECFPSSCLQSDCICFPAGKLGCKQANLPRPRRKLMKIKDLIQTPDKHLKYFAFFLSCCWLLQLIYLSWQTQPSLLKIWIWLETTPAKHLGFCPDKICKAGWNSTAYACSKNYKLCFKCIDLSLSPAERMDHFQFWPNDTPFGCTPLLLILGTPVLNQQELGIPFSSLQCLPVWTAWHRNSCVSRCLTCAVSQGGLFLKWVRRA